MNKTIYKYYCDLGKFEYGCFILSMVKDSKILSVENQRESICIWAEGRIMNVNKPSERRVFYKIGTGKTYEIKDNFKFIGTVMLQNGDYVYHIYEEID